MNFKGALPDKVFSKETFPKVFAWMGRFDNAIKTAKAAAPKVVSLKGTEAAQQILSAEFAETEKDVDPVESQSTLRKGDQVEVFPTDSGSSHHEKGTLVSLMGNEIVIRLDNGVRLHTPRIGFRVRQIVSKM